jgi:hypothetical protein
VAFDGLLNHPAKSLARVTIRRAGVAQRYKSVPVQVKRLCAC